MRSQQISLAAPASAPPADTKAGDLLLVLPFVALLLVQLARHTLWIDEINAYGVAVASPRLGRLFTYLHYEAHPSIWYLLLWPIARLTANPLAMKWLQGAVGIAIYLLIALRSPFSRSIKVLLYLSYFISFEYTVLSRMYGVLLLEVLIYADWRVRRPDDVLRNAFLLALMANTDTMGILLGFAFAAEYILHWREERISGSGEVRKRWAAALLYFTGIAMAIITLRPAPNISHLNTGYIFGHWREVRHFVRATVGYVVLPWFPISTEFPHHFWNPDPSVHIVLYCALIPIPLLLIYFSFRLSPRLLAMVGLMITIGVLFGHLIYMGYERHYGIVFLAFVVALWIQTRQGRRLPVAAVVLLVLSAAGGVAAAAGQWAHPFSYLQPTAQYIRNHRLEDQPLIVAFDPGVAELLQKPAYFLECECSDRFLLFSSRRDQMQREQIPARLQLAMQRLGTPRALYLGLEPLTSEEMARIRGRGLAVTPLSAMTGGQYRTEATFLYQLVNSSKMEQRSGGRPAQEFPE